MDCSTHALLKIKAVIDGYFDNNYTLVCGDDFNTSQHIYDISVIMGILSNLVYSGLKLDIPARNETRKINE